MALSYFSLLASWGYAFVHSIRSGFVWLYVGVIFVSCTTYVVMETVHIMRSKTTRGLSKIVLSSQVWVVQNGLDLLEWLGALDWLLLHSPPLIKASVGNLVAILEGKKVDDLYILCDNWRVIAILFGSCCLTWPWSACTNITCPGRSTWLAFFTESSFLLCQQNWDKYRVVVRIGMKREMEEKENQGNGQQQVPWLTTEGYSPVELMPVPQHVPVYFVINNSLE